MKKVFLLLFFFSFLSPVCADRFSEKGDNSMNTFFQTISYSIDESSLPASAEKENSVIYNGNDVVGNRSTSFISSNDILTLTQPFHMFRKGTLGTFVSVPPYTKIDIAYYYVNRTGHSVNIREILVPFSLSARGSGDISRIAKLETSSLDWKGISFFKNNSRLVRNALFGSYVGLGVVQSTTLDKKILDSLTVQNPIELDVNSVTLETGKLKVAFTLGNSSGVAQKSLTIKFGDLTEEVDLNVGEKKEFLYELLDDGETLDWGYIKVTNNQSDKECSVFGTAENMWFNDDSPTVYALREDGGWAHGSYVKPDVESFCITRIPYSMTSGRITVQRSADEGSLVNDGSTVQVDSEVLGISHSNFVLPKTAKVNYGIYLSILVVGIYLWYSVKRCIKYGKEDIFTKLCSEGCKNSS